MSKIYLFVPFIFLFSACSLKGDACNPEQLSTRFQENQKITLTEDTEDGTFSFTISEGDKQVFKYEYVGAECPEVIDDETGENFYFEIGSDLESFEYTDEELASIQAIYQPNGAWIAHLPSRITEGSVSGERISSSKWEISVDVVVGPFFEGGQTRNLTFKQIFTKI
ncbi:hypothetical protein [Christiangramia flava]|uniref:Uncharacterized protein n=1 Tax=Christiangramia flava JLT2011 TaxID=1229726 RepID=A0A1L7I5S4_9FLAO|nr:hypothetical protein [Christiangramia flava]APU68948.1 hypothetical protein GRFL_2224 [Christiangramia flava JLT2011]OSS38578.1 hypothetical protein C723_2561 [Christiangramia flava JLT2011]